MEYREYTLASARLLAAPLSPGMERARQSETARRLLGIALNLPDPLLARAPGGKPFLPGLPGVHFSLSHCPGLAVCLVAGVPCGVDAEAFRTPPPRTLRRALSPAERRTVSESPRPEEAFFRIWTAKEAFVKATGDGLPAGSRALAALPGGISPPPGGWHLAQTVLDGGFAVSAWLACESKAE